MSDKFLNIGGTGNGNISNGTATIFGASIGAEDLDPSQPVKTNSTRQLVSTKLDIADINSLQSILDDTLSNPFSGTLQVADLKTTNYTSLDAQLDKIQNIVSATETPDVTTMKGELIIPEIQVDLIKPPTGSQKIDFQNNNINIDNLTGAVLIDADTIAFQATTSITVGGDFDIISLTNNKNIVINPILNRINFNESTVNKGSIKQTGTKLAIISPTVNIGLVDITTNSILEDMTDTTPIGTLVDSATYTQNSGITSLANGGGSILYTYSINDGCSIVLDFEYVSSASNGQVQLFLGSDGNNQYSITYTPQTTTNNFNIFILENGGLSEQFQATVGSSITKFEISFTDDRFIVKLNGTEFVNAVKSSLVIDTAVKFRFDPESSSLLVTNIALKSGNVAIESGVNIGGTLSTTEIVAPKIKSAAINLNASDIKLDNVNNTNLIDIDVENSKINFSQAGTVQGFIQQNGNNLNLSSTNQISLNAQAGMTLASNSTTALSGQQITLNSTNGVSLATNTDIDFNSVNINLVAASDAQILASNNATMIATNEISIRGSNKLTLGATTDTSQTEINGKQVFIRSNGTDVGDNVIVQSQRNITSSAQDIQSIASNLCRARGDVRSELYSFATSAVMAPIIELKDLTGSQKIIVQTVDNTIKFQTGTGGSTITHGTLQNISGDTTLTSLGDTYLQTPNSVIVDNTTNTNNVALNSTGAKIAIRDGTTDKFSITQTLVATSIDSTTNLLINNTVGDIVFNPADQIRLNTYTPTATDSLITKSYVDTLIAQFPVVTRVRITGLLDIPPTTGNAVYEDEFIRLGWDNPTGNDLEIQRTTASPQYNSLCRNLATNTSTKFFVDAANTTYSLNTFAFAGGDIIECMLSPFSTSQPTTAPAYRITIHYTEGGLGTDDDLDWVVTRYNL